MEMEIYKELAYLECDEEYDSIFGILDIYRRSALHASYRRELPKDVMYELEPYKNEKDKTKKCSASLSDSSLSNTTDSDISSYWSSDSDSSRNFLDSYTADDTYSSSKTSTKDSYTTDDSERDPTFHFLRCGVTYRNSYDDVYNSLTDENKTDDDVYYSLTDENKTDDDVYYSLTDENKTDDDVHNLLIDKNKTDDAILDSADITDDIKKEVNVKDALKSDAESLKTDEANTPTDDILRIYACNEEVLHTTYTKIRKLGSGATGQVILARDRMNTEVAIKVMNLKQQHVKIITNEITIMKRMRHENIVKLVDVLYVERIEKVWIVMDYMAKGPLTDIVDSYYLKEVQIAYLSQEILKGLAYLHSMHIIHRDIKSDNILIGKNWSVKIADVGYSIYVPKGETTCGLTGTIPWIAPDMLESKPYNHKVDIWSFGITVLEMINGSPPYFDETDEDAIELILKNGTPEFSEDTTISPELNDFLNKCLNINIEIRSSANELLAHTFLKYNRYQKDLDKIIVSDDLLNK